MGSLHWRLNFGLLCLVQILCLSKTQEQCRIKNGECMYNIQLVHPRNCGQQQYEGTFRDYSAKGSVESDQNTANYPQEQRIKDLESSVAKLIQKLDGNKYGAGSFLDLPIDSGLTNSKQIHLANSVEEPLISRLQGEFKTLRNTIKSKTETLFNVENKLNETQKSLSLAYDSIVSTSRQLVLEEEKSIRLEQEGRILRNQIRDSNFDLLEKTTKLNETESKRAMIQDQLYDVIRSESNLKEEKEYFRLKMEEALEKLNKALNKYTDLEGRHERTMNKLMKSEEELVQCYAAKTQAHCGFEGKTLCGFFQETETDNFDWEWIKGKTPSKGTGPSKDHTCQSDRGHFMYIEASAKGRKQNAVMSSPRYKGLVEQCVEFFYHMHGRHIGTLNVYTKAQGNSTLNAAWRAFGNQGDVWISARLPISESLARAGYHIVFEGLVENGYLGDISIDDVSVTDGACPVDAAIEDLLVPYGAGQPVLVISDPDAPKTTMAPVVNVSTTKVPQNVTSSVRLRSRRLRQLRHKMNRLNKYRRRKLTKAT